MRKDLDGRDITKDICKMNIDLWTHQNTLMWSRLNTLWFSQVGFLAIAHYLASDAKFVTPVDQNHSIPLSVMACWMGAIVTFFLWSIMHGDRAIRNIYRVKIENLDLDFFPASLVQERIDRDSGTRYEPGIHFFIFSIFIGIDLYASSLYSFGKLNVMAYGIGLLIMTGALFVSFEKKFQMYLLR